MRVFPQRNPSNSRPPVSRRMMRSGGRMINRFAFVFLIASIAFAVTLTLHAGSQAQQPVAGRSYVGSATCARCHVSIAQRWAKTRMANVVTDPKAHPDVVIPDFSKA